MPLEPFFNAAKMPLVRCGVNAALPVVPSAGH
jgi:hypothetical protein